MSMIVGYDCEMTPLRAGDKVIILKTNLEQYRGVITSVLGMCPRLGAGHVEINIPCNHPIWEYYSIGQEFLKKVGQDFKPSSMSFTELMDSLKENTHA